MRRRLTSDQAEVLALCALVEGRLTFRTSMATGTIVEHRRLPGGAAAVAVVDIWDLADEGLIEVAYGETEHSGSFRLTPAGRVAAADEPSGPSRNVAPETLFVRRRL